MIKRISTTAMVWALPLLTFAQSGAPARSSVVFDRSKGLVGIIQFVGGILNLILPLIVGAAVVYFMYNVFKYAVASEEDDKTKAKTQMIWGVIGIFVIVSVWGLVNILGSTFNLDNTGGKAPVIQLP